MSMESGNLLERKGQFVGTWRQAFAWGVGIALVQRIGLAVWLAIVWSVAAPPDARVDYHAVTADLPALVTDGDRLLFGVWRRWDAVHYLDLAANGYRADHPGPTVFGVLTPVLIRAGAALTGGLDAGAMLIETVAFALALTLLIRFCAVYFEDAALGRWGAIVLAASPLAHFFAAPMSESPYLAATLGVFYFGARGRWLAAAVCGLLATLARSQGALLAMIGGILLLEQMAVSPRSLWKDATTILRRGWALAIIPLGVVGFEAYRSALALPPLSEVYATISFNTFVDPLTGLWINLRPFWLDPGIALITPDLLALPFALGVTVAMIVWRRHRRPALIAYNLLFLTLFVSRINFVYGTDEVMFTQSMARYTLVLFPCALLIGDVLRSGGFVVRIVGVLLLLAGTLGGAALHVLGLTGP